MAFAKSWDNYSHTEHYGLAGEIAQVKIKKTKKAKGAFCKSGEWALIDFKGHDLEERYKFEPKLNREGSQKFILGNYQVSTCWDIAI